MSISILAGRVVKRIVGHIVGGFKLRTFFYSQMFKFLKAVSKDYFEIEDIKESAFKF